MNEIQKQINDTISLIKKDISAVTKTARQAYQEEGRGAFLIYTENILTGGHVIDLDYRTKQYALDLFDNPTSKKELSEMISKYDTQKEAIFMLITDISYATCFIKLELKP